MREREIAFLENQLSVLYGPMYVMLKTNERVASATKVGSAAYDYQQAVWRDVIIPNNTKIVNILQANFHLFQSHEISQHILAFIAHAEWQKATGGTSGTVPSGVLSFPEEFAKEIYQATEALKATLDKRRQYLPMTSTWPALRRTALFIRKSVLITLDTQLDIEILCS